MKMKCKFRRILARKNIILKNTENKTSAFSPVNYIFN